MRVVFRVCLLGAVLPLAGCPAPLPAPQIASSLRAALDPNWTLLPEPDSRMVPGAIVEIIPPAPGAAASKLDLRYEGSLALCGWPDFAKSVEEGATPAISAGTTVGFDASLGAKLAGVGGQIGVNSSSQAALTIGKATFDTLPKIALQNWTQDPANAAIYKQKCGAYFSQPGYYVVSDAFVISSGSYTFLNSTGGSISVTPPPTVPVTASADVKVGDNGSVTITQPVVFALHLLQPLPMGAFADAAPPAATAAHVAAHRAARHALIAPPPPAPPPGPLVLTGRTIGSVQNLPARAP